MEVLRVINYICTLLFFICYSYQLFYIPVSLFFARKRKAPETDKRFRYAVLICARNEAAVIGDLLESIRNQTYDASMISVFVLADNCTDETAEIAEKAGAVVYKRFNEELVGKGYAMNDLLGHLKEDYPEGFDGYFVFDADNILKADYIEQMNRMFAQGHNVITSYRNSKNYGDNLISAGSGLWFLRESRYLNHARWILHTSSTVSGTGYLVSRKIIDQLDGWPFHLLTEDLEFSAYQIINKDPVAYCADAEFFDEQPKKFRQSFRQRVRWSRGYLQVIRHYGTKLLKGIFKGNFGCFDILMNIAPAYILSIITIVVNSTIAILSAIQAKDTLIVLESFTVMLMNVLGTILLVGVITTISEWKNIRTTPFKKILYALTFPIFMLTYVPIATVALFHKPKWKPVEHTVSVEELRQKEKKQELHDITNDSVSTDDSAKVRKRADDSDGTDV